ncbi:DUF2786 domain-containing protein [Streptomyces sp. DT193]|uniref:DUF2786 domain-containing protein n=1 Tax=Streptomyces sp. DT193 TaxID=3393418 RepID=UPI003CF57D15
MAEAQPVDLLDLDRDEEDWLGLGDAFTTVGPDTPRRHRPRPRRRPARLPADLLAKVKAILRMVEDPAATQAEPEAFLQKATALMAKYGIEQAMLRSDDSTPEQPADRVITAFEALRARTHSPSGCERAYAYAARAGNTTTEPSVLRAISIATSVVRLLTTTSSPSL